MIEKYLVLILAGIVLFSALELLRREKLTFKYAFGWIMIALLVVVLTVFDGLLYKIASLFGFELRSDFVLFIFLSAFVFLTLMMTLFLCQQNSHNDTIAQKLGILEFEIKKLREKMAHKEGGDV
jgi:hypothetical protein